METHDQYLIPYEIIENSIAQFPFLGQLERALYQQQIRLQEFLDFKLVWDGFSPKELYAKVRQLNNTQRLLEVLPTLSPKGLDRLIGKEGLENLHTYSMDQQLFVEELTRLVQPLSHWGKMRQALGDSLMSIRPLANVLFFNGFLEKQAHKSLKGSAKVAHEFHEKMVNHNYADSKSIHQWEKEYKKVTQEIDISWGLRTLYKPNVGDLSELRRFAVNIQLEYKRFTPAQAQDLSLEECIRFVKAYRPTTEELSGQRMKSAEIVDTMRPDEPLVLIEYLKVGKPYYQLYDTSFKEFFQAWDDVPSPTNTQEVDPLRMTDDTATLIGGTLSFYAPSGELVETVSYSNKDGFLNAIHQEIYHNPAGFKVEIHDSNPELTKTVNELFSDLYGVENVHDLKNVQQVEKEDMPSLRSEQLKGFQLIGVNDALFDIENPKTCKIVARTEHYYEEREPEKPFILSAYEAKASVEEAYINKRFPAGSWLEIRPLDGSGSYFASMSPLSAPIKLSELSSSGHGELLKGVLPESLASQVSNLNFAKEIQSRFGYLIEEEKIRKLLQGKSVVYIANKDIPSCTTFGYLSLYEGKIRSTYADPQSPNFKEENDRRRKTMMETRREIRTSPHTQQRSSVKL